jgi:hypothetical protein
MNTRCYFILLFLCPNIAGAFGLRFVPTHQHVARLIWWVSLSQNTTYGRLIDRLVTI